MYPRFFPSMSLGRCLYATKRGYVGLTHSIQNEWKQSFTFAHVRAPVIT